MRHPRLIVLEADGWLARQLRELTAETRWLVHEPRTAERTLNLVRELGPAVLLVQVEPHDSAAERFQVIADAHRQAPDVPVVAISDVKLPDADRVAWTAELFDLGASYVLFPPLARPVLEDVVSGLMATAIRHATKRETAPAAPLATEDVIDLADEDMHG